MDAQLRYKYICGECDPRQNRRVEDWLEANPDHQNEVQSMQKIWAVAPKDEIDIDATSAWDAFQAKLEEKEMPARNSAQGPPARRYRSLDSRPLPRTNNGHVIAACLAAAAMLVIALLVYHVRPDVLFSGHTQPRAPQGQIISTGRGERSTFRLADGTRVQLNVNSQITISPGFGQTNRRLQLQGQAYFNVTKNPDMAFVVQSGGAYTRVLGTKFGLKAYPPAPRVQVVVEEGQVLLGSSRGAHNNEARELTKNQLGTVGAGGQMHVANAGGAMAKYLGWKDGQLVFESTPFRKVTARLERWYDIQIEADPSLGSQKVTASFADEPMAEVLQVLAVSVGARLQTDDRNIRFNSN